MSSKTETTNLSTTSIYDQIGYSAKNPRTSLTHPINISWLFTSLDKDLVEKALDSVVLQSKNDKETIKKRKVVKSQAYHDILDTINDNIEYHPSKRIEMEISESNLSVAISPLYAYSLSELQGIPPSYTSTHPHWTGNFALSSCPGKKVRLDFSDSRMIPTKAIVNRDIKLDLARIAQSKISIIICCLDDSELHFLGVTFDEYEKEANRLGMTILRIPIVEGNAPKSIESVNSILDVIDKRKENVLCHCRGGIGRAGVIAVCFLLRKRYFGNVEDAVAHLRSRRSRKAIETGQQMQFLYLYQASLQKSSLPSCAH